MGARRYIVFDCETYLTTDTLKAPPVVSVALWDSADTAGGVRVWLRDQGVAQIRQLLEGDDCTFIGHNVAYDFTCLAACAPDLLPGIIRAYDDGRVHDTLVMERLRQIAEGIPPQRNSLAHLVERHLGNDVSEWKEGDDIWRLRYAELDGVPVDEWPTAAREYAILDVEWTRDVYRTLWAKGRRVAHEGFRMASPLAIHTADRGIDYEAEVAHQTRAAFVLHQPYVSGVRIDRRRLARVEVLADKDFITGRVIAKEYGLVRENGTKDMARIREAVEKSFEARGETPPLTDKGATSTASDTLRECVDHEGLQALAASSKAEKLLTAFIKPLNALPTPVVHSSYNVLVDSGRTSARRPNVQQVSRDGGLRECYVARPGHVFIGADYDTLEMRSLAQVAYRLFGMSKMREVLQSGRDLHLAFGASLLGIPYEEAVERKASGDPEVKEARQFAKVADFGFPGGLGARTFCDYANGYGISMTEARARTLKDQFVREWPEMQGYFRAAGEVTRGDDPTRTKVVQGYGRVRGNITYTRACNTPFQGLAADGAKEALWLVQRACWTPGDALCGSRIALFVHDEIIIETPESDLKRKGERLVECMVEGMQRWIPDVPITAESVVMRRWSKDAHNNDNEVWDA